jgi:hypothetical protein
MGGRIERIANESDLYASTLIREIVEVYVIDQEGRRRALEDDEAKGRQASNAEKLRSELIGLNEDIMALVGRRKTVESKLQDAAKRESQED